jgi:hypothetical protein
MTSSFAEPSFGSVPYTQHHKQNPSLFSRANTQNHVYGTYEAMIRSDLTNKLLDLGPSLGNTRLSNLIPETIDSGSGSITETQLVGQYINVTGAGGQTLSLPSIASVPLAMTQKFGPLHVGMTVPVTILNNTTGTLTITAPGSVFIGVTTDTIIPLNALQLGFIRIPNDTNTYEYINTSPNVVQ